MKNNPDDGYYILIPRQSSQCSEPESTLHDYKSVEAYAVDLLLSCKYVVAGQKLGTEQERILFLKPYFITKNEKQAMEGCSSALKLLLADQDLLFFSANPSYRAEIANKQYWANKRGRKRTYFGFREGEAWLQSALEPFARHIEYILSCPSATDLDRTTVDFEAWMDTAYKLLQTFLNKNKHVLSWLEAHKFRGETVSVLHDGKLDYVRCYSDLRKCADSLDPILLTDSFLNAFINFVLLEIAREEKQLKLSLPSISSYRSYPVMERSLSAFQERWEKIDRLEELFKEECKPIIYDEKMMEQFNRFFSKHRKDSAMMKRYHYEEGFCDAVISFYHDAKLKPKDWRGADPSSSKTLITAMTRSINMAPSTANVIQPDFLLFLLCCQKGEFLPSQVIDQREFSQYFDKRNIDVERVAQIRFLRKLHAQLELTEEQQFDGWCNYIARWGKKMYSMNEQLLWREILKPAHYDKVPGIGFQLYFIDLLDSCLDVQIQTLNYDPYSPLWKDRNREIQLHEDGPRVSFETLYKQRKTVLEHAAEDLYHGANHAWEEYMEIWNDPEFSWERDPDHRKGLVKSNTEIIGDYRVRLLRIDTLIRNAGIDRIISDVCPELPRCRDELSPETWEKQQTELNRLFGEIVLRMAVNLKARTALVHMFSKVYDIDISKALV